jgi:hypothetical protein
MIRLSQPAAPPGVVFVMGNASYPSLPALPVCAASASATADAFAKLGFSVLRAAKPSNADAGAQLAGLDIKPRTAPAQGKAVPIYLCG